MHHRRSAAPNPADLFAEALRAHCIGVDGRVSVEIIDDESGRVLNRMEAPNYVVVSQWEAFARAVQKLAWTFGYQGDASTVTVRASDGRDPRQIPTLRNEFLACWSDSTAENTADKFPFGEVTAWAHRWQQGSLSTRQGVVQPALCTLSDSAVSWVFEWATGNGNGTFQSVGWRRLAIPSNSGDPIVADSPIYHRRLLPSPSFSDAVSVNGVANVSIGTVSNAAGIPSYYDSATGRIWALTGTAGSTRSLISCPVTIDSQGNYTLGAVQNESANVLAAGLRGNTLAVGTAIGLGFTRLGTSGDWVVVGHAGASSARRPEIRRVTPAGSVSYTNLNAGTFSAESLFLDVTYDGTDLWATAATAAGANTIHRINPATGAVTATISTITGLPAYWVASAARGLVGIEWDPTNAWLWVATSDGYTLNVDTSGNWLGALLHDTTYSTPITPATLSGQHNAQRAEHGGTSDVDTTRLAFLGSSASQTAPGGQSDEQLTVTYYTGQGRGRLFRMADDIWHVAVFPNFQSSGTIVGTAGAGKFHFAAFTGGEAAYSTRSLLGSPATKTNTQTMRITYTLTFT